jgi:hypothetical protein
MTDVRRAQHIGPLRTPLGTVQTGADAADRVASEAEEPSVGVGHADHRAADPGGRQIQRPTERPIQRRQPRRLGTEKYQSVGERQRSACHHVPHSRISTGPAETDATARW